MRGNASIRCIYLLALLSLQVLNVPVIQTSHKKYDSNTIKVMKYYYNFWF